MRLFFILLVIVLVMLQYKLWVGDGGVAEVWRLKKEVEQQQLENSNLKERNMALEAEVKDLKQGFEAVEERARNELGMIRNDETFFQTVEENP